MKRITAILLALLMALVVFGCAQPAEVVEESIVEEAVVAEPAATEAPAATEEPVPTTMQFTDSADRTVELPMDVTKVAVSGPLAQIALFALCPDKLVGVANAWDAKRGGGAGGDHRGSGGGACAGRGVQPILCRQMRIKEGHSSSHRENPARRR